MKRIAYTQRVEIVSSYGERRDCADQRIPMLLHHCGYVPIPLPNICDIIIKIIDSCNIDGIVLTGGNSLVKYGGEAPERDDADRLLIEIALSRSIPLYGFCRGMQSVLDYYGCRLNNYEGHVATTHRICGEGIDRIVNSYHNQGCKDIVSDEIVCEAKSEDGMIEMIRHKSMQILGTMWHPERGDLYSNEDISMIRAFFH